MSLGGRFNVSIYEYVRYVALFVAASCVSRGASVWDLGELVFSCVKVR